MSWRRIVARFEGPWPASRYWLLSTFALLALLCWLPHPYYGEEPVYSITTIETWFDGSWMNPIQLGGQYGRPPLMNWLAMPLIWLLGWEHMLLATRLLSAASTIASAALLAWFAGYLSRDRLTAVLAAACYLTGDLLTRRGWMAYSDPLFSIAAFAAMVSLWLALDRRSARFLALAGLAVTAAFLTKALTAYAFYGAAGLVLLWRHPNRRFLFSPASLLVHGAVVAFVPLWIFVIAGGAQGEGLVHDFLMRAQPRGAGAYVLGLLSFWGEILLRMLPTSALLLVLLIRPPKQEASEVAASAPSVPGPPAACPAWMVTLRWITFLGALPYLATPDNHMRHVLPLYPLFALIVAELALRRGQRYLAPLRIALAAWIVVTIPLALAIDPWIEARRHGDAAATAALIAAATRGHPLYTIDGSSETLAVVAHLDALRLPAAPIIVPMGYPDNCFNIGPPGAPAKFGREIARYPMGKKSLALYCKGDTCPP
jgi:4-amino-4-deoxy-L-arabinose transferase-like glycosyltransferase